jgi:hypothetical protein
MQKLTENRCINYKCKLKNKVENSWEEAQEKIHCDTGLGKYHSGGHEWELMDRDKCSVLNRTWTRLVQLNWALWTSSYWISSIYCTLVCETVGSTSHDGLMDQTEVSLQCSVFAPWSHTGPWSDAQFPSSFTHISMVSIVNGT